MIPLPPATRSFHGWRRLPLAVALPLLAFSPAGRALAADPADALPDHDPAWSQSLDGSWKFKYVPGTEGGPDESFREPGFDVAPWARIPVPGHWELHGFAEPTYKKVDAGLGLYRRTFRIPSGWTGRRVFLRFEGVLYGLSAWVNGRPVGEWASAYNPVTFDVTDALRPPGEENVLAVRVTTRSKGWEFDTNDCWALSGIYREVSLYALPATHLRDYTARTTLRPDGSAAVELELAANGPGRATGRLVAPDGAPAAAFDLALPDGGHGATTLTIARPALWTAETPSLYRLELDVRPASGGPVHRVAERIGLRQVTIDQGVLRLNGTAVKLRGINHHDIWPAQGRVATEALLRRDLEMMREANINFVRTSHYPPHRRLVELCDELGIYVMDEVPFGYGDKNLTDPSFEQVLLTRALATVKRDKNRPSVLVWSIGNENPLTELGTKTALYTKKIDPTRPVCVPTVGSYFSQNVDRFIALPAAIDVFAPHYPGTEQIRGYAEGLARPIIATEYSHALGLAFDGFQAIWEIMYQSPRTAGGAVWMFQDQGIRREVAVTGQPKHGALYVWPDATHYFDTAGTDGCDGIVYSDRTPQADYWQVRKVYAPVRIAERRLEVGPGPQTIPLHVENRHDFRTLAGMSLNWTLRVNGAAAQTGVHPLVAAPRGVETVKLPVTLPADLARKICTVELACVDQAGRSIVERAIRLEAKGEAAAKTLLAGLSPAGNLAITRGRDVTSVAHARFRVDVRHDSGAIEIQHASGERVASGFRPHASRRFTMAEELRVSRSSSQAAAVLELRTVPSSLWRDASMQPGAGLAVEVTETAVGARILVRGRYPRAEAPDQELTGEIVLEVTRTGTIEVAYSFAPINAKGQLLEAGLAMLVPDAATEFRWLGAGPYAGYPGKDALNEPGMHHLARGDLRFRGNRREVELALLTRGNGEGVLLAGTDMNVAVEDIEGATMLSHNALVSGLGNKGGSPENKLDIGNIKVIAGRFTIVPLGADWPEPLVSWFGKPDRQVGVLRPFFRSYDQ